MYDYIKGLEDIVMKVKNHTLLPENGYEEIKYFLKNSKNTNNGPYLFEGDWIEKVYENELNNIDVGNVLIYLNGDINLNLLLNVLNNNNIKYNSILVMTENEIYEYKSNKFTKISISNDMILKLFEAENKKINTLFFVNDKDKNDVNDKYINKRIKDTVIKKLELLKQLYKNHFVKNMKCIYIYDRNSEKLPYHKGMVGFSRTINKEVTEIFCKNIGLEYNKDINENMKKILNEINNNDDSIMYVDEKRYVYDVFESKKNQNKEDLHKVFNDGVFIIAGGMGGLGLIITKYLSRYQNVKIILLGRSIKNKKQERIISDIEKNNVQVEYIQGDITDKGDVERVITYVKSKYNHITGIINSSGYINDQLFINKSEEDFKKVISAKVLGTINLDECTKNEDINLFVLFSSITSVVGNVGQCDYGYANSFLDNFGDYRKANGHKGRTVVINWPLWRDGGMKVKKEDEQNILESVGSDILSKEDGIKAFEVIIEKGMERAIVACGDKVEVEKYLLHCKNKDTGEVSKEKLKEKILQKLTKMISDEVEIPVNKINSDDEFTVFGINSVMSMSLVRRIEKIFGNISKTLFYEFNNLNEMADYFVDNYKDKIVSTYLNDNKSIKINHSQKNKNNSKSNEVNKFSPEIYERNTKEIERVNETTPSNNGDIAIIGIGGRYPKGNSLEEFWENIKKGTDCIIEIPKDRWDYKKYYTEDKNAPGKSYSKWGGFIDDYDKFDPLFFNISPREASILDPQERIFLETVWHCLEDSGYKKSEIEGKKVGVYVGVMYSHYQMYGIESLDNQRGVATTNSSIANRISYFFNLNGPSMSIDTMCSSSLTALDIACKSILANDIEAAIVGGVNLTLHPNKYVLLSEGKFLSSEGRCKSFEDGGNGYVPGEGVGAILLKPLNKAVEDGDYIHAVIKGTSLNHGGRTSGFTVPNPNAQSDVIYDAIKKCVDNPRAISYIEAHGTGTALGDPIEIKGLTNTFRKFTNDKEFCSIGSLKSIIGHLESAAGIAGLTKVILQLEHKQIAPSIVRNKVNSNIDFKETPFHLVEELTNWERPKLLVNGEMKEYKRIAGISAFGAGGSNAHVVLEEYDDNVEADLKYEDAEQIFILSAKDSEQLKIYAKEIADYLSNYVSEDTVDILKMICSEISKILNVKADDINEEDSFDDYGFDLYSYMKIIEYVKNEFGISLPEIKIFNNISELYKYIIQNDKNSIPVKNMVNINILAKAAITLQLEREDLEERIAFIASDINSVVAMLRRYSESTDKLPKGLYGGNVLDKKNEQTNIFKLDEAKEMLRKMTINKRKESLCLLWTSGINIEWKYLHKVKNKVHMKLPHYLFKRERYFVNSFSKESVTDNESKNKKSSTWIDENVSDLFECKFIKRFSNDMYFIKQHCVDNKNYLQGVYFLLMALSGIKSASKDKMNALKDILWIRPFIVGDEENNLYLKFKKNNEQVYLEFVSDNKLGHELLYCKGNAIKEHSNINFPYLEMIESVCNKDYGANNLYKEFYNRGITYGDDLKVINNILYSDNFIISDIDCSKISARKDFNVVLLDGAIQTSLMLVVNRDFGTDKYIPYSAEKVQYINELTPICRVYIRRLGTIEEMLNNKLFKFDALIVDNNKKPLMYFKNFVCRSVGANSNKEIEKDKEKKLTVENSIVYSSKFIIKEIMKKSNFINDNYILFFINESEVNETLEYINNRKIEKFILIINSNKNKVKDNNIYFVNRNELNSFNELFDYLNKSCIKLSKVIYLWNIENRNIDDSYIMLSLSKHILKKSYTLSTSFVYFFRINKSIDDVYGKAYSGFLKTLSQENPKVISKLICSYDNNKLSHDLDIIFNEMLEENINELEVCYKENVRYINNYYKIEASHFENNIIKSGKTYLITGGAGGIGRIIANYLANNYHSNIILVGRSKLDDKKKALIDDICKAGVKATYIASDITSSKDADELRKVINEEYGNINGIIHAAGVLNDGLMISKSVDSFKKTLDPKILGITNLVNAFSKDKLDFFAAFSSIASVIGNIGQCDYSYANCFMDNYIKMLDKNDSNCKYISINWTYWQEGGMLLDDKIIKSINKQYGITPLETNEGIHAFLYALNSKENQVIVYSGDRVKIDKLMMPCNMEQESKKDNKCFKISSNLSVIKGATMYEKVHDIVLEIFSDVINIDKKRLKDTETLGNYGVDSVVTIELISRLEEAFGTLPKTLLFECINIKELCEYLVTNCKNSVNVLKEESEVQFETEVNFIDEDENIDSNIEDEIAIIGISGKYPKADNLHEFWENLKSGKDCICDIPIDRWNKEKYFSNQKGEDGKTYSKWGGFINDIDKFEPLFFNISPIEAIDIDPQERLLLEETYKAIEDAGYKKSDLEKKDVGVFVGSSSNEYQLLALEESLKDNWHIINSSKASIANRISYFFDFNGPSVTLDTMCSSSLTALHMACKSILEGESEYAVVGGVNLIIHPYKYVSLGSKGFLSSDGRCNSFGDGGDGYVPGEGVCSILLKPLKKAIKDGDNIYCSIKETFLNHGGRTRGYTVPNPKSQAALIKKSLTKANVNCNDVSYIEMHGTGTVLGDPIEIDGVNKVFENNISEKIPCGSVKSNIGHLEAAAGVAAITKVILQMKNEMLVPSIHCNTLNKNIDFNKSAVKVQRDLEKWNHKKNEINKEIPYIATISSFGAGGSNSHVILKEYVSKNEITLSENLVYDKVFTFSARTNESISENIKDFIDFLENDIDESKVQLKDIAYTLKVGREAMDHRVVVIAENYSQLINGLKKFINGETLDYIFSSKNNIKRDFDFDINYYMENNDYNNCCLMWVSGYDVNWDNCYRNKKYKRVSLPTYNFEKERYWITKSNENFQFNEASYEVVSPKKEISLETDCTDIKENTKRLIYHIFNEVFLLSDKDLSDEANFEEYGIDSILIKKFNVKINKYFNNVSPTILFECNSIESLTEYFISNHLDKLKKMFNAEEEIIEIKKENLNSKNEIDGIDNKYKNEDIAIIGLSGKYPGADNMEEFWEILKNGVDCISLIPKERWNYEDFTDSDPSNITKGYSYSKYGCFVNNPYKFDTKFFNISPAEAEMMDPQERMFLEVAWETIEDSGYAKSVFEKRNSINKGKNIGVFVGTTSNTYNLWGEVEWTNKNVSYPKVLPWSIANRVSYTFNLKGPSIAIDTACSSSLASIHMACQSIKNGECNMAIAGGVNLYLHPSKYALLSKARMLSKTGRCHSFGSEADGFVPGEGIGAVMLKRMSKALEDKDRIYAVIKGSALNHGGNTNGYTVPNPIAQAEVIKEAIKNANISPSIINHIEAHGTGTELGDPIEIKGLVKSFSEYTDKKQYCAISSVKSNIGHSESAAGIAGLTKLILELKHKKLVSSLFSDKLNNNIKLEGTPFYIQHGLSDWQNVITEKNGVKYCEPRTCAISSFGAGGLNAHIIIQEYCEEYNLVAVNDLEKNNEKIIISAMTKESLFGNVERIRDYCIKNSNNEDTNKFLNNLSYTLKKRGKMKLYICIKVIELSELIKVLSNILANNLEDNDLSKVVSNIAEIEKTRDDKFKLDMNNNEVNKIIENLYEVNNSVSARIIDIPFYAFNNKEYNIPKVVNNDGNRNKVSNTEFAINIDTEAFYFKDHKVNGERIVPAAMYLEFVNEALNNKESTCFYINDIIFGKKIAEKNIIDGIKIEVKGSNNGIKEFCIKSYNNDIFSIGKTDIKYKVNNITINKDDVLSKCSSKVESKEFYDRLRNIGFDYGSSMSGIKKIYFNDNELFAFIENVEQADNSNKYGLHPTVLDSAFQSITQLMVEEKNDAVKYLPYSASKILIYGNTKDKSLAYVKLLDKKENEYYKFVIEIMTEDCEKIVSIGEYMLKAFETNKKAKNYSKIITAENNHIEIDNKIDDDTFKDDVTKYLKKSISSILGYEEDEILDDEYLEVYGIDSVSIMNITSKLEEDFGSLPKTIFFEYKTILELVDYFIKEHNKKLKEILNVTESKKEVTLNNANNAYEVDNVEVFEENINEDIDVAIIGISGKYPQAENLNEFWENIKSGRDCITEIPECRWDYRNDYDSDKNKKGSVYAKWGGFIDDYDKFDPLFFNISPKEAKTMDPQERLFLKSAYHAMEDAGYTNETLSKCRTAVYVGAMYGHYELYGVEEKMRGNNIVLNSSFASIANRVSYILNLNGPSMAVDTMCSSSLSALHLACNSLKLNEVDMAIAGGVNLSLHPNKYSMLCYGKYLSSDGKCRSFGEGGDGYVPGEGVGAVILKPLAKAIKDKDHIYGIIKSTALNHGGKTNGYSVPNPISQAEVIKDAIKKADINPKSINYIETHGTGTALGDPIEILSLNKAYSEYYLDNERCAIGSVKSNIGHLESAAGMAALTKVLLQMKYRKIVPSIHSKVLNEKIDFSHTPFYVEQNLENWERKKVFKDGISYELPRCAGISSFGAGGANAHVIIQEYVNDDLDSDDDSEENLFVLSAKDDNKLKEYLQEFVEFINENSLDSEDEFDEFKIKVVNNIADILGIRNECINLNYKVNDYAIGMSNIYELLDNMGVNISNNCFDIDSNSSINELISWIFNLNNSRKSSSKLRMKDLTYTLQVGREQLSKRIAIIAIDANDLKNKIVDFINGRKSRDIFIYSESKKSEVNKSISMDTIMKERNLRELANRWVLGEKIKWDELYEGEARRRISLPNYPFYKERYWFTDIVTNRKDENKSTSNLDANYKFKKNDWFVKNHTINGKSVVPGAVLIDLLLRNKNIKHTGSNYSLKNISFNNFIEVGDNDVNTKVVSDNYNNQSKISFKYNNHSENKNSIMEAIVADSIEDPPRILENYEDRYKNTIYKDECYEFFKEYGLDYGNELQTINKVMYNNNSVLATLKCFNEHLHEDFIIDPRILDGALQSVMIFMKNSDGKGTFVPYSIEKLILYKKVPKECLVYVEKTNEDNNMYQFNLIFADADGNIFLEITGYSVKEIESNKITVKKDSKEEYIDAILLKLSEEEISINQADKILRGLF